MGNCLKPKDHSSSHSINQVTSIENFMKTEDCKAYEKLRFTTAIRRQFIKKGNY